MRAEQQVDIASGTASKTDISSASAVYASDGGKAYALAYTDDRSY